MDNISETKPFLNDMLKFFSYNYEIQTDDEKVREPMNPKVVRFLQVLFFCTFMTGAAIAYPVFGAEAGTAVEAGLSSVSGADEGDRLFTEIGMDEKDESIDESGTNEGDNSSTEIGTNEGDSSSTETGTNEGDESLDESGAAGTNDSTAGTGTDGTAGTMGLSPRPRRSRGNAPSVA